MQHEQVDMAVAGITKQKRSRMLARVALVRKNLDKFVKAGVQVKAVFTSLNTAFLPISRSRFKRR